MPRYKFPKGNNIGSRFKKGNKVRKGQNAWNKGRSGIYSEETLKKMRKAKTGKHISRGTRIKIANKLKGNNSHFWKGGITPKNAIIREGIEYSLWREAVFARDNWTCQKCGKRGYKLNAHHLKRFSQYPELRFAIDNGTSLCVDCHKKLSKK